jgi:secondary thiamine-phosphate synthase enzyme
MFFVAFTWSVATGKDPKDPIPHIFPDFLFRVKCNLCIPTNLKCRHTKQPPPAAMPLRPFPSTFAFLSFLLFPSILALSTTMPSTVPRYFQHQITVTAPSRGCHLITNDVLKAIGKDLKTIDTGLCNLFCQHTSASLTINENADPDVRTDMETALNKLVPAEWCRNGLFRHTMEGDDDMPGHVKSSLMGVSLTIPVRHLCIVTCLL